MNSHGKGCEIHLKCWEWTCIPRLHRSAKWLKSEFVSSHQQVTIAMDYTRMPWMQINWNHWTQRRRNHNIIVKTVLHYNTLISLQVVHKTQGIDDWRRPSVSSNYKIKYYDSTFVFLLLNLIDSQEPVAVINNRQKFHQRSTAR